MANRTELLEAALDIIADGVALMDSDGNLAMWNRSAAAITGYAPNELLGRRARTALEALIVGGARQWTRQTNSETASLHGSLVEVRHRLGHTLPALVRVLVLRDGLGGRIGTATLFHPAERLDALPHGEFEDIEAAATGQAEFEDKLQAEFEDSASSNLPFGVLWVTVDQAHDLRRTHGARACEAMLEKLAHALGGGLRPSEELGRWGDDEFLVICHERSAQMLKAHAQMLAGLARTTDFRWWGDRVSLTVSIGAAQSQGRGTLAELLRNAQDAMRQSIDAGGNLATNSTGRQPCSQS
jgi:diguanylate cyclase (GGDEF)-like protein/PAS domain S-box-containing protein